MRIFLVALALSLAAAPVPAQSTPEQRVDSLFGQFNRAPSPGVAISVVRDGRVVLAKGYGLASIEHRVPITPATVFDLASVSKQFTGMLVAMLVDEGRIALSDDVRKYIPELPDAGHTVTIDHLVHHTSGIRDWPGTLSLAGWRMDDVVSFDQILNFAYNQRTLNFPPGTEHLYSNTGYNLLAEMISRVSGKPFAAVAQERLFAPLGMSDTRFLDDHTRIIPNRAYGYSRAPNGEFRYTPNALTGLGSSSLFSTVNDLAKWVVNFDNAAVGGGKVMAMTRMGTQLADKSSVPYAFGIVNGVYKGLPMLNHSGGWASFSTFVMHFPKQRFGVVVLSNGGLGAGRAAQQIADIYLEKELAAPLPANAAAVSPVSVAPEVLDRYTGLYKLGPGWYVRIRRDGNALRTQATREAEFLMTSRSDSVFWVDGYSAIMMFRPSAQPVEMFYRGRRIPRIPEVSPTTVAQLAQYTGVYESGELGTSYRVEMAGDTLVARHARNPRITLTPLYKDEFITSARFMSSVEFFRDASGKVTGMSVKVDDRSRDIRFTRRN
jgi:CubicO group peptidase (beta-lactamase class C family)